MKVISTLSPGQNGTKQLLKQYGDQLLYVRYRYDQSKQKRYKTVELIIDEQDWIPGIRMEKDRIVRITLQSNERELRQQIIASGGIWDISSKSWYLSYHKARALGIEDRVTAPDFNM